MSWRPGGCEGSAGPGKFPLAVPRPTRMIFPHKSRWLTVAGLCLVCVAAWFSAANTFDAQAADPAEAKPAAKAEGQPVETPRVTLAVARERAEMAHLIYASTLEIIHRYYFRKGQAVLPARAMEEVFAEVAEQSKVEGRWISVNTRPMSVHHEPRAGYEKQAATALAGGQEKFEIVESGHLRSVRAIPLGEGCLNCHTGMFRGQSKSQTPRVAGLVISIPIQ